MTPPNPRRAAPDALAVLMLAALPVLGALPLWPGPVTATLKLGPNTGAYLSGFLPSYEIAGLEAARWTSYDATAALPFTIRGGPVQLSYRFARVFGETAVVDVSLGGRFVDHFTARGGQVLVRHVTLPALPPTHADVRFQVDSHERRGRGLRMDWIRVATGPLARVALRGPAAWLPAFACAALFVLFRALGHRTSAAALLATPWALACAVWPHLDPLAFAHVTLRLALPVVLLAALATLALRRVAWARWAVPLLVGSYLIKGAGLFHPTSFYPDVQNARRYVNALAEAPGTIAERTLVAQERIHVGYPRFVAGRPYAFPYSPLPYLPLRILGSDEAIEDGFRQGGLVCAALEVLLVFALARLVCADGLAAVFAAVISAFVPPHFSRLLIAMEATLVGHLFDVALIAAATALALAPRSRRRLALVAACALASLLLYVSSLFTVSAFLVMLALLERPLRGRLLAVLTACAGFTVAWLYTPFTRTFFLEILPALGQGATAAAASSAGLGPALGRILIFYGWAYPLLALAGLVVLRRRADPRAYRVLCAYGLAFLLLLGLRAFGAGLFRDLKEITFVAPLVAVLTGAVLAELARRGRGGQAAAALVALGLVGFGLARYRDWLREYASPFVVVHEAPSFLPPRQPPGVGPLAAP